jgi:hypothetical protein
MTHEGGLDLGWWGDVLALVASLIFAWPLVRTSFRLRNADKTEAAPSRTDSRQDDVLSRVWSRTAAALREPIWTSADHWSTLIAFAFAILATVLKVVSHWI